MVRLYILAGFILVFLKMQMDGDLNKYINIKYAYLPKSAVVLLSILFIFEAIRYFLQERRITLADRVPVPIQAEEGCNEYASHAHKHSHSHSHAEHDHFGHSHAETSRFKGTLVYLVLLVPVATGLFLPVKTLDSSFVKARGFSFPGLNVSADNPGFHQFLKPDTSVFYGKSNYNNVSQKELAEFTGSDVLQLNDTNFLKGLEALYNHPGDFMGKSIGFTGFIFKGEQTQENDYFVFRFGFIHCVADSGVFGMLVEFPKGTAFHNDDWVHVTGTLTFELYQPFKQTIPVLKINHWNRVTAPEDPYVYRTF